MHLRYEDFACLPAMVIYGLVDGNVEKILVKVTISVPRAGDRVFAGLNEERFYKNPNSAK